MGHPHSKLVGPMWVHLRRMGSRRALQGLVGGLGIEAPPEMALLFVEVDGSPLFRRSLLALFWVAVKGAKSNYHNSKTILGLYIHIMASWGGGIP